MSRLLVVVAHPDDETFGCGSLLLHAAARGWETRVWCATRGEAGESTDGTTAGSPAELGRVREAETRAAAAVLGVGRVDFGGFADSGMSGPAEPDTLAGAPLTAVRDAVVAVVEEFEPTLVISLDASDGHRDHVRIGEATWAATPAGTPVYLFGIPQTLMRRWVEHMAATDPSWEHLRSNVPGTPAERISVELDTSAYLAERERAMAFHRSQRSPFDGLPDDLRRAFLTTDVLCRVQPPWDGVPEADPFR